MPFLGTQGTYRLLHLWLIFIAFMVVITCMVVITFMGDTAIIIPKYSNILIVYRQLESKRLFKPGCTMKGKTLAS